MTASVGHMTEHADLEFQGDFVRLRFNGVIARITLTAEKKLNSVTLESCAELRRAVDGARHAGSTVVVLDALGKGFCVGGDIDTFVGTSTPGDYIDDLAEALHRVVSEFHHMDAVVLNVVQGVAAGAGMPLTFAGDLVLAGESARFTLAYTKSALSPDGGSSTIVHSLGMHRVLHMALLNPILSAKQAQEAGLVFEVVPDEQLAARADEIADQLAAMPHTAQMSAKRLVRAAAMPTLEADLRRETLAMRVQAETADCKEGVRAFVEKRKPVYNQG